MSRIPQLILTLAPDGQVVAEIPFNGGRRHLPLSPGEAGFETIRRILAAQLHRSEYTIGTDGAPTVSQIQHWQNHLEYVDLDTGVVKRPANIQPDTCIWCLAHEMGLSTDERAHRRARAILREQRRAATKPFKMGDGSVTVRHIPTQAKELKASKHKHEVVDIQIDIDLSELGL